MVYDTYDEDRSAYQHTEEKQFLHDIQVAEKETVLRYKLK
jgi:hypothetical protein